MSLLNFRDVWKSEERKVYTTKIHGSHGDGMDLNIRGGTPNTKYKVRSFQGSSFELSIGSSVLCIQVAR